MRCPNCGLIIGEQKHRSNPQNSYFHGIVLPILAENTGHTVRELKNIVKSMFLQDEFMLKTKNGVREMSVIRDTSELTTVEFEKFMTDIRTWASESLGCYIPQPNEENINAV
jgi:hypothetical protein